MLICTPRAAARNESFWQINSPPIWSRCMARILPGYGAAKATTSRPGAWLVKVVMKSDSPVRARLPADTSLPRKPVFSAEGSPKTVCMLMPGVMNIMPPASPIAISPGRG
jgi:hypothetical protein